METINVEECNADIKSPFLNSYTYMCVRVHFIMSQVCIGPKKKKKMYGQPPGSVSIKTICAYVILFVD